MGSGVDAGRFARGRRHEMEQERGTGEGAEEGPVGENRRGELEREMVR